MITGNQLGLTFDPVRSKNLLLSERFLIFHYKNPQVYDVLVRLARQAVDRGKKRIGMGMLWEIMRWEMWLDTKDDDGGPKFNNSYRSRYARKIMETEPDLADVFETRKLKSS